MGKGNATEVHGLEAQFLDVAGILDLLNGGKVRAGITNPMLWELHKLRSLCELDEQTI